MAVLGPHVFDSVPLMRAAAAAGVPIRTAQRWLAAYSSDGSVERSGRSDRSTRRLPAEQVAFIEAWPSGGRHPRWRRCIGRRVAAERGWPAPSYSVVHRVIAALGRGLVSLAQHGDAGYRDEFDLVLRRESAHPNDLWQADHTELDVMILDEAGKAVRPWLTVILDDRSRAVA